MDISIKSEEGKFKFRVCGVLEHNNKYLLVKMNENNFYCLPGGHVELGEDTDTAVVREMQEELGYQVKIKKPSRKSKDVISSEKKETPKQKPEGMNNQTNIRSMWTISHFSNYSTFFYN